MSNSDVEKKLLEVFRELIDHDGYGSFSVNVKILKRNQKEILIDCGKQYRFVIDSDVTRLKPTDLKKNYSAA